MNDDLHDPELEAMLGRASGAYPDVNVAYESVCGRVRQAKRRRMVVVGTGTCALLLAATVIGVQAGRDGADGTSVADTPTIVIETSRITATTEDDEDGDDGIVVEETTLVDDSDTTDGTDSTESSAPDDDATTEPTSVATSPSVSPAPSTSSTPSSSSSGSSSTSGTTKPTLAAGTGQVASSPGGSVTYSFVDGVLTLVGVSPADGWTEREREVEDDRIRVEFEDAERSTTWRVEIRTEGGKAPVVTSEHG